MVKISMNLSDEANRRIKIYMANHNKIRKEDAINEVLEELDYK